MDVETGSSPANASPPLSLRGVATLLYAIAAVAVLVRLSVSVISFFLVGPTLGLNLGSFISAGLPQSLFAFVDVVLFLVAIVALIDVARRVRAVPESSVRAARWAGWLSLIDCIYYCGAHAVGGVAKLIFDTDHARGLGALAFAVLFAALNSPIIAMAAVILDRTRPSAGRADPPLPWPTSTPSR
jgi:hypothetical protein